LPLTAPAMAVIPALRRKFLRFSPLICAMHVLPRPPCADEKRVPEPKTGRYYTRQGRKVPYFLRPTRLRSRVFPGLQRARRLALDQLDLGAVGTLEIREVDRHAAGELQRARLGREFHARAFELRGLGGQIHRP